MNLVPSIPAVTSSSLAPAFSHRRMQAVVWSFEWLVLLLALWNLCARTLPNAWNALNTDFPNYYITAHMLRNGESTDRVYEWTEIQRQKDRLGIDQPVVGFIPLTPVSALPIVPLANLSPLNAKRCWISINLALMVWIVACLASITDLPWRRIALLAALTLPIHHNIVLGQAYILLLALLTLSLWCYLRERSFVAGVVLALAFGMKIFPLLFLLFFVRKREWGAVTGLLLGSCGVVLLSIAAFGLEMNRTYAVQVLPWALRGEALDPYSLHASSLSAILHRLFVFEPEWNPHPLLEAPLLVAIFHPLIQLIIFAPVLLFTGAYREGVKRTQLEWAAFTVVLLAISTSPAFYDFTILLLPAAVIVAMFVREQRWHMLACFMCIYLGLCFPFKTPYGARLPLMAPRLFLLILLCGFCLALLYRGASRLALSPNRALWMVSFAAGLIVAITLNIWHQTGLYDTYRWRVPTSADIFAISHPVPSDGAILFTAMLQNGYRAGEVNSDGLRLSKKAVDQLSETAITGRRWTEEENGSSEIVSATRLDGPSQVEIHDATFPVVSADASLLAFQRSERGYARLWLQLVSNNSQWPITPTGLNVMEMSFFPNNNLVISASAGGPPHLFIVDRLGNVHRLTGEEARYPAVSPDGQWLAYSRLRRGTWNLWLRNLKSGKTQALTEVQCNNISPAWAPDSKTLIYASDCGRGLWLTALCRRRVLP